MQKYEIQNPPPFTTSERWLAKFKKQCDIKKMPVKGEVPSTNYVGAQLYPSTAEEIRREGGKQSSIYPYL